MADANHTFGADLVLAAGGDLSTVTGIPYSEQRVLRRLMTNPGEYLWDPTYGAGLPGFIGQPINAGQVTAIVQAQLALEDSVAASPAPVVTVTPIADGLFLEISFTEATTGQPTVLSFSVTP